MPKRSSKTLIYAPEVTIYIATQNNGVVDVSDDIVQGQVRRIVNGVSQASFVLNNRDHKYMGVLGRMDRVVIFMKRIKNIQVFAGYLDSVPAVALYTNTVNVRASCTLKLIQNTFWDQGLPESQMLLNQTKYVDLPSDSARSGIGAAADTGLGQMMAAVLEKVGGWKRDAIIIQNLPSAFLNIIADADAATNNAQYVENLRKLLGFSTSDNTSVDTSAPTSTTKVPKANKPSNGKTYTVADLVTIAKAVGFIGDSAVTAAAISYASTRGNPNYISTGADGEAGLWSLNKTDQPNVIRKDALDPIKGGKLFYTFTKLGKDFSKSSSFANNAYKAYLAQARAAAAKPDTNAITYDATTTTDKSDSLTEPRIDFINDQHTVPKYTDSTPEATLKGIYGNSAEEVKGQLATIMFQGRTIQVHKKAANAFRTVDAALTAANLGYKINTMSTFEWRTRNNGSGTSALSLHSFGVAIDINEATNGSPAAGLGPNSSDFPTAFINVFKKNGFEWGGDWAGSKDYMHFQWMGGGTFSDTETTPGTQSGNGTSSGDLQLSTFEEGVFKYLYMGKSIDPLSEGLQGDKAPVNDVSLLSTIQGICSASLRSFMSAPDGSFIAFYPDYFGTMGSKTKMVIEDIELLDFGIDINDDSLVTDLFVAASTAQEYDSGGVSVANWYASSGVMNIRDQGAIKLLLGIDPSSDPDFSPDNIYAKFGMRPLKAEYPNLWSGAFEKAQALYLFQKKWSEQYSTRVSFTFLPELYPGMRILVKSHGVEVYVEEVTHSFGYDTGFSTIATVSSPATVGGGIKGMPLGRL